MSLNRGYSLKGYEWLLDGKVIMRFFFKDETMYLYDDVDEEEYHNFHQYLKDKGWICNQVDCNNHKIIFKEDE